jgi:hypothetical protein
MKANSSSVLLQISRLSICYGAFSQEIKAMGCSHAAQPDSAYVETVSEFTEQKVQRRFVSRLGRDY